MTREEAAEVLRHLVLYGNTYPQDIEALRVALEALERVGKLEALVLDAAPWIWVNTQNAQAAGEWEERALAIVDARRLLAEPAKEEPT